MKKINCYMTFTDEQYLPCVIRQAQRIKYLNSKYEYIVMVDENDLVSQKVLKENNIHYISIKQKLFSQAASGRFQKTFNKFKIIDYLDKYEKICWLDADTILTENIDYLFDKMSINCQFLGFFNKLINISEQFPLIHKLFFTMSNKEFNNFIDKYFTQLNDIAIQWTDLVNTLEKI